MRYTKICYSFSIITSIHFCVDGKFVVSVCVCILQVYVHVCVYTSDESVYFVCAHPSWGWRSMSGVFINHSSPFSFFETSSFSEPGAHKFKQVILLISSRDSSVFPSPVWDQRHASLKLAFVWGLWVKTLVLMLAQQVLYQKQTPPPGPMKDGLI